MEIELWQPVLAALIFTVISGTLTYLFGLKTIVLRERFRNQQRKIDEIRAFLGGPAERMLGIANSNFDLDNMIPDEVDELRKEIRDLHAEADRIEPFFVNDEEVANALTYMGNFPSIKLSKKHGTLIPSEDFERFSESIFLLRKG